MPVSYRTIILRSNLANYSIKKFQACAYILKAVGFYVSYNTQV